jgi:hypothetical protein
MIKGSATESQATPGEHRPSPGFFFGFLFFVLTFTPSLVRSLRFFRVSSASGMAAALL